MNKWVLMMTGFAFVIVVGVVTVIISEKSNEEVAADISLLSGVRLTQHGQQVCQKKIKNSIGKQVYSPTSNTGDRVSTVTLAWSGKGKKFNKIVCTYNIDQGVTSLIIDDKTIIAK